MRIATPIGQPIRSSLPPADSITVVDSRRDTTTAVYQLVPITENRICLLLHYGNQPKHLPSAARPRVVPCHPQRPSPQSYLKQTVRSSSPILRREQHARHNVTRTARGSGITHRAESGRSTNPPRSYKKRQLEKYKTSRTLNPRTPLSRAGKKESGGFPGEKSRHADPFSCTLACGFVRRKMRVAFEGEEQA